MKCIGCRHFLFLLLLSSALSLRWRTIFHLRRKHHMLGKLRDPKIVGGTEAPPHSIPYQAGLFIDGKFRCGATLITNRWVLTAAHCAEFLEKPIVSLGAHDIYDASEPNRQLIESDDVIVHEDYDSMLRNDMALVHLRKKAKLNEYVDTIQLASSKGPDYAGSQLQISGWGRLSDNSDEISRVLQYVNVHGISNFDCGRIFEDFITEEILCVSTAGGKGSCFGDSGGPLVHIDTRVLVGVTSFGAEFGCELGYPAVFTRVSSYKKWIAKTIY